MSTAPRLTIDLNALVENWRNMSELSGNAHTSAVIKANGYGLGIKPVAKALSDTGCTTFFTAMLEEALAVREVTDSARIFVLNGIVKQTVDEAIQGSIIPVLSSTDQIALWGKNGKSNPSAIHVDTGMNRSGLSLKEAQSLSEQTQTLAAINPLIIMSHLACGDEPEDAKNADQLVKFQSATQGFNNLPKSFANSAGIFLGENYRFDLTRPGISLYGGEAVNDVPNPMNVVATAHTRILQIRDAKKGETVGYGASQILERDTKIAVCSIGYADGFHRSSSGTGVALRATRANGGKGAIDGHLVPILGRVSMDLTTFDVTDVPEAILENSSWIELFGKTISVDDAARSCGTIGYELLTSLGQRYQRTYLQPNCDEG